MKQTKAQLEAELAEARKDLFAREQELRRTQDQLATTQDLHIYVAHSHPGQPLCISGRGNYGLQVVLYLRDDEVVGAEINDAADTLAGAGLVAFDPDRMVDA